MKSITSGTLSMSSVNVLRLLTQLLSVPILARVLSPEDYGLAAMAMPVIIFVMMLADAGLGVSLVRTGRSDDSAWHTCFWLSAGLGTGLALGVAALSPIIGLLFNQPRLTPIIIVLAIVIPTQTLTMVPGAALQQQKRFGIIALIEIAAMATSISTAVLCSVTGFGVWALVWQQVVFYAVRFGCLIVATPYRPRLIFNLHDAREHVIFGRNLLGANLIGFASRSLETLAIGKIYGPAPVGIYSMSFQFARLPFMIVTGPFQYVLYPHIAPLREDKAKIAALFLLFTRVLATLLMPGVGLVAAASDPIFSVLLSQKWGQAAPIFVLIAPAAALQPVTAIIGTFLMALGRTDVQVRLAMELAILWFIGLMASVWFGIEAVAATYSICTILFSFWTLRVCLPLVSCSLLVYAKTLLQPIVLTVLAILVYGAMRSTGAEDKLFNIGLAALLLVITIAVSLALQRRHLLSALSLELGRRPELAPAPPGVDR